MPFFSQFPVLETKRLVLRELKYDDGPDIYAYFSEGIAQYYDWLPATVPEGRGFVRYFKSGYRDKHSIRWAITVKPRDKIAGTVGFSEFEHFSRADLGYELAKRFWGQGLMSEALEVIIPFGFQTMGLHRIQALVVPENTASIHLLEKFGFQKEGLLRQYNYVRHRNVWEDNLIMALLREG
ncbi:MAG: GNAT family N-acetyltransferase [Firmicutes bacterium]|mgnify:CR=1 FL=1|nr:GNAT family N-acetyltransferase [Bacillota bacterium]